MRQQRTIGDGILVFVTLCWGVTFPLVHNAMNVIDPFVFVTIRFLLASLLVTPFIFSDRTHFFDRTLLLSGFILGAINVVIYNAQSIGLETISGGQSAFITGLCVVIVPFLLPFFRMGAPTILDVISSIFCLIGLALLTGLDLNNMSSGCLWTLLCAFSVALSIVYLQKISQKSLSLNLLAFYQILFTGVLSAPFSYGKNYRAIFHADVLIALVFCAVFATSIALLLQTRYQRLTTASRAAMIFCLEPLFASLFDYWINGQKLSFLSLTGGLLIIASLLIPELYRMKKLKYLDNG